MAEKTNIQSPMVLRLGNYSVVYLDANRKWRQRFLIVPGSAAHLKEPWWRLNCCCRLQLCGFKLGRKHLTFRHCRVRKVAEGTFPADIQVDLQMFTVNLGPERRFPRVKNLLIKQLKSIIEWLGD